MKDVLTQRFDINEGEDEAVFCMRRIGGRLIVIIPKSMFKAFETQSTIVLEYQDPEDK